MVFERALDDRDRFGGPFARHHQRAAEPNQVHLGLAESERPSFTSATAVPPAPCPSPLRSGFPQRSNRLAGSAIALISSALPEGSRKNIVACSPGWPRKRIAGLDDEVGAGRLQPLGQRLPRRHVRAPRRNAAPARRGRRPDCDARRGSMPGRDGRRSGGRRNRSRSIRRRCALRGSRAGRRRRRGRRRDRGPGKARWKGGRVMRAPLSSRRRADAMRRNVTIAASFWIASSLRSSQ